MNLMKQQYQIVNFIQPCWIHTTSKAVIKIVHMIKPHSANVTQTSDYRREYHLINGNKIFQIQNAASPCASTP